MSQAYLRSHSIATLYLQSSQVRVEFYLMKYVILVLFLFPALSLATPPTSSLSRGSNGGFLLTEAGSRVEIKLTRSTKKVDIFLLDLKAVNASLLLSSEQGAETHLELDKAPFDGAGQLFRGSLPSPPTAYVGLVLKITLDNGKKKVFRTRLNENLHFQ